jgi:hypothetical protein
MQRAGGASTLSAAATFGTYLNANAKATVDMAWAPPAPPNEAATKEAASHLMLTGGELIRLLTMVNDFQLSLVERFGSQFPLSKSAVFAYGYEADGSSFWVLPDQVARVTAPPPRAPCTQPLPWTEPLIRCVALCLQMLQTLTSQGAPAMGLLPHLKVYSFPVNAMPQMREDGEHVCQAMRKVQSRLHGMVPTIGGMLDSRVLFYPCADIFPVVMKPTALDNQPGFFAEGGEARRLALDCLEFYTQLAAEFDLLLGINSSRGLKLLHDMVGNALSKCPVAAGELGVGYHFQLAVDLVSSAGVTRTVWVRGYGTKHPCWWWSLLFILACYRAQVANMGHCGFGAPGLSVVVGRYVCSKPCCRFICTASSSWGCSGPSCNMVSCNPARASSLHIPTRSRTYRLSSVPTQIMPGRSWPRPYRPPSSNRSCRS